MDEGRPTRFAMTGRTLLAGVAAACLLPAPGLAQPAEDAQADTEILVTGSRIPRPNDDSASPIQSVTPQDFILTGVPNVEQTLNQLPQLVPSFTNTSNNPGSGAATLNLRGLGSVRTLILVNGRRWIASDAGETPEVDVNTIPAALIERVDVVTGGASAVYGSDAVTGVINFVLRRSLEGVELQIRQNVTEQGDGRVSSADLSFGTTALGGRARLLASVGWLDQAPVIAGARPLSRVTLQEGCAAPGTRSSTGASVAVTGACAAPNEIALVAGGSLTVPGGRFSGRVLFPVAGSNLLLASSSGLRFDPDGTPRPLNPLTDRYNFAPENFLQVGLERWSANLLAAVELAPAFEPYLEASFIVTRSPQQLAAVPATIGFGAGTVPFLRLNLDNPFLTPEARAIVDLNYGVDAQGDRGFLGSPAAGFRRNPAFDGDADGFVTITPAFQSRLDLGPRGIANRREAYRGLIGARGEVSANWSYDVFLSHSQVEHLSRYSNSGSALRLQQAVLARRDASGQIVCIDPSGGCVPANVFGANNLSRAAADFVSTDPVDVTRVEEQVAEASIHGQIGVFPAGPAGLAIGVSWRRTAFDFQPDLDLFTGDDLGFQPGIPAAGSTRVWEMFGETRIPILRRLTAELGVRWSRYDTVGGVWTWKALAEWEAIDGLRFRGGWQRAVRAPNARELYEDVTRSVNFFFEPCSAAFGLVNDPAIAAACVRNGVPADRFDDLFAETDGIVETGGNPDIDAETARTLTLGATIAPRWAPGLQVAVDYYDIRIRDAIGPFGGGGTYTLFGCVVGAGGDPGDPLCQAFDRDANGFVTFMRLPSANLPELRATGIDWQIAFSRRFTGVVGRRERVEIELSGTRTIENSFLPSPHIPRIECAGEFGQPCGTTIVGVATPRWKLANRLAWSVDGSRLTLRHRWFSSTVDGRIANGERLGLPGPTLSQEGRRLEGRHYFDLAFSASVSRHFDFTIGVNNLTGRSPAVTGNNQVQANTDPSLYDVLGRRFFVAVTTRLD
jgi:iron complex outermembrane receptor protein